MVHGKKVTLRPMQRDDVKRPHALSSNVDLVPLRDGNWNPSSLAASEKDFDKHLEDHDNSLFVIVADDKVIGLIEPHSIDRRSGTGSLGIAIYDLEYIGRGHGTLLVCPAARILSGRR